MSKETQKSPSKSQTGEKETRRSKKEAAKKKEALAKSPAKPEEDSDSEKVQTEEELKETQTIKDAVETYKYDESILKRRKKKLQGNGVSLSVPKKSLTAYAIFVKKVSLFLLTLTETQGANQLELWRFQIPRDDEGTWKDVEQFEQE